MKEYPALEKYYYYQHWDGKLPETMLGSDTGIIMDLRSESTTATTSEVNE